MPNIPIKTCLIKNFGDYPLNSYLYKKITGQEGTYINIDSDYEDYNFSICGSVLQHTNKNSIVWGSGFISHQSILKEVPRRIYAVRGVLTRNKLVHLGIECPDAIGDPALLLPKYYTPKRDIKYKLGIIPHYTELVISTIENVRNPKIKIIDITKPVEQFIDEVNQCECVVSSSLHGLIVCDAYQIPNGWIKLSNMIAGQDFKYFDYFSSIGRMDTKSFKVNQVNMEQLIAICKVNPLNIDLDKLLECCPLGRE